ncbi:MAG: leucine-rich repeat domain-containing protein [Clostridia bacterium]|nr:leucine-rich repeat domain-containing protein [Clostridia bacterium]
MRLKKLLSVVMAVAVLTAILPLKAFMTFAELVSYSGTCGDDLTWEFDPSSATLTISGTGNMDGYLSNYMNAPWYPHCKDIEAIIIGAGVIGIGTDAFYGCTRLTSISIPSGVQHIGSGILEDCNNLESITVDKGNLVYHSTGNCLIKTATNVLIAGCKNSIIPTDGSVCLIEYDAFSGCTGLTSITMPDSVTSIGGGAFEGCTGLTSITIPDSVTAIGYKAFSDCTGLTSINIPDSVISVGGSAFDNTAWYNNQPEGLVYAGKVAYEYKGTCPSRIIIKEGARYIRPELFLNCTDLVSVTMPHSVMAIGDGAFKSCEKLTSITIPDSVISIGADAFRDCAGLTSATIGNSVTSIGHSAFYGCASLTSITIPNHAVSIGDSAFENCSDLKSVKMGNSIISIGSHAFYNCVKLASIVIPDSVVEIGCSAFEETKYYNDKNNWENGALYICRHLIRINSDIVCGNYVIKYGTKSIAYAACGSFPSNPYFYPELT